MSPQLLCWAPSSRQTYVLKLARSGEDGDKVLLLIESGARFHTVEVGREGRGDMWP